MLSVCVCFFVILALADKHHLSVNLRYISFTPSHTRVSPLRLYLTKTGARKTCLRSYPKRGSAANAPTSTQLIWLDAPSAVKVALVFAPLR